MKISHEVSRLSNAMFERQLPLRKGVWLRAAATVLLIAFSGCVTAAQEPPADSGAAPAEGLARNGMMEFRIGPSDVLSISVRGHQDLEQTAAVRPDGKVSFPLLGDVAAAGKTPVELQRAMESALGEYINILPGEVTVVVDSVHSYKVSVLGEVRKPGRFEFHNRVSVLDVLAQAEGLTEFADSSKIMIFRTYLGENQKLEFDYDRLVKAEGTAAWVPVLPGDIVLVP